MSKRTDHQKSLSRMWAAQYDELESWKAACWVYDFWKIEWGPPPGTSGCQLPPALAQVCLNERHKISVNDFYQFARGRYFPEDWGRMESE